MNNPDTRHNDKTEATDVDLKQSQNLIGADPDEQAMNGLYGMAETIAENQAHKHGEKG